MAFRIQICRMPIQIDRGLFQFDLTDYHAILGVPIDGDEDQVRQRYYQIARQIHPDKCRTKNHNEKQQASEIFSKLVNPAYEKLSKEKGRTEYGFLLSDLSQKLAAETTSITFTTEAAQKLKQAHGNLELKYKQLLQDLTFAEYQSLNEIINHITQISELNLCYLVTKKSRTFQPQEKKKPARKVKVEQSRPIVSVRDTSNRETQNINETSKQTVRQDTASSSINTSIRRGQELIKRGNFSDGILELREALKKDPNNSTCHGLLGLAYLKQNQLSMAKIHINRAWKLSPNDPVVIEAKRELNKIEKESGSKKSNTSSKSKGGGLLGSLFGRKNK